MQIYKSGVLFQVEETSTQCERFDGFNCKAAKSNDILGVISTVILRINVSQAK